jgi:hypothetical protein
MYSSSNYCLYVYHELIHALLYQSLSYTADLASVLLCVFVAYCKMSLRKCSARVQTTPLVVWDLLSCTIFTQL